MSAMTTDDPTLEIDWAEAAEQRLLDAALGLAPARGWGGELVARAAPQAGLSAGEEANIAKLLASEASWAAGEACVQTHGGFAFAEEFDIERKFRETRLYQVAPISTNLILAFVGQNVLGMPRSY